jgi:lysophospholipase L1-like esterase
MASLSIPTSAAHENQHLSKLEFQKLLQAELKYKARSHNTYQSTHAPELNAEPKVEINTVLIGDSMLERLKNTGRNTRLAQLPSSFNAGVGGDKIENVLYRLDLGLMSQLETRNVKLWVVMIGTNNLKKALKKVEVERYRLLLQALLRISPTSRILCCEIFKRKDIVDYHVKESNRAIRGVLEEMNGNLGEKIFWVEAPEGVTKERLVDHVHLDKEGYRLWDELLYARVEELLK